MCNCPCGCEIEYLFPVAACMECQAGEHQNNNNLPEYKYEWSE